MRASVWNALGIAAYADTAYPASASQWQGFVVSPDADPRPPESCLRGKAAGAVSCSTSKTPREAPLMNKTVRVYVPIGILSRDVFDI